MNRGKALQTLLDRRAIEYLNLSGTRDRSDWVYQNRIQRQEQTV
jgi:hypothetical protein